MPTIDKTIDQVVTKWCAVIADEVAERRFYDKAEVAIYAKAKLRVAVNECVEIQTTDLEKKRAALSTEYSDPKTPIYRKDKIKSELSDVNLKLKERKRYLQAEKDSSEYHALKSYVKTMFGEEALQDFFYKMENDIDFKDRAPARVA